MCFKKLFQKKKPKSNEPEEYITYNLKKACVNCAFYDPYKVRFGRKYCNYYKTYCNNMMDDSCKHYIPYK